MLTWPGPGVETPVCTYETHLRGLGEPRSAAAGFVSSTRGLHPSGLRGAGREALF